MHSSGSTGRDFPVVCDNHDRVASLAAQPIRKVQFEVDTDAEPLTDGRMHISADTIGNQFPRSALGNASAQTWQVVDGKGGAKYYVTVSKDHKAQTTWNNFSKFARRHR